MYHCVRVHSIIHTRSLFLTFPRRISRSVFINSSEVNIIKTGVNLKMKILPRSYLIIIALFFSLYANLEDAACAKLPDSLDEEESADSGNQEGSSDESSGDGNTKVNTSSIPSDEGRCLCWIGRHSIPSKKIGELYMRPIRLRRSMVEIADVCRMECFSKCDPLITLDRANLFCKKIDEDFVSGWWDKLGCFSSFGSGYIPFFNPSNIDICCKKPTTMKSCQSTYGPNYKYSAEYKLCLRQLDGDLRVASCSGGDPTPPVCCLNSPLTGRPTLYDCRKPKYGVARSVKCM